MTETTTLRRPGRPRKAEPIQEETPVVEQAMPAQEQPQEQPQQAQYVIAKLTPHMLAGEIHRLHQEGEDLTPVHEVSDGLRGKHGQALQAQPDSELQAAVEAAKSSVDKPRTFAVAYRNPRGVVKVAHGVHFSNGHVHVESGHGYMSGGEDSMADLRKAAEDTYGVYHVDYTDEP